MSASIVQVHCKPCTYVCTHKPTHPAPFLGTLMTGQ